jgi:RimJ/RimL family protein N-acetyltransferase
MTPADVEGIRAAGKDLDWAWMSWKLLDAETVAAWIRAALSAQESGGEYPFVVRLRSDDRIIGSTRYLDTHEDHKTTEVGWTWYSRSFWGTVVNPECKLLLLNHAFEDWGAIRVQLKTDSNNLRSQRAILKLGAKFEGRLRNHRIRPDGTIRDTMMYSIVREEWPLVKESLERRIEAAPALGA